MRTYPNGTTAEGGGSRRKIAGAALCVAAGLAALAAGPVRAGDYPTWRGPHGTGAADSGQELVGSFDAAQLAWVSQAPNPLPYDYKGLSRPHRMVGNGGFGPPLVWDGKVYVAHFIPSGPKAKILWGNVRKSSPESVKHIAADDAVSCIDAQTGLTLWTARFQGAGLNFAGKMYAGHYVPAIAEGRVVWVGSLGRMHCIDARTGKKYWSISTGWEADLDRRYLEHCLEAGKMGGRGPRGRAFRNRKTKAEKGMTGAELAGSRGFGWDSITVIADGVAAANTRHGSMVGVDVKTGKVLWRFRNALKATRGPALWRHGGQSYFIAAGNFHLLCVEPRTGKVLWRAENELGRAGYDGYTPVIQGDTLIATARTEGWGCWDLTLEGPKARWSLPPVFKPGYESPVIYRGAMWMNRLSVRRLLPRWDELAKRWPKVFTEARRMQFQARRDNGTAVFRNAVATVDLDSGEVIGLIGAPRPELSSMIAADGRIFWNPNGLCMLKADPRNPELLGHLLVQNIWCTSPIVVDGRLYARGVRSMVLCWDLRADRPAPTPPTDWRNARIQLDLAGIRQPARDRKMILRRGQTAEIPPGTDLRLHLRTRQGKIAQAWMTYGPGHVDPEQVFTDELRLVDGKLGGILKFHALGLDYAIDVSADLTDPALAGTYADQKPGKQVDGQIRGRILPLVRREGKVRFRLRREWNGGQNQHHETHLEFELKDGRGINPRLYAKVRQSWTATVDEFDVALKDGRLAGTFVATTRSGDHTRSGTYRVRFDTRVRCNFAAGRYRSWRGDQEITPSVVVNQGAWGQLIPSAEAMKNPDPANAVHEIILEDAIAGRHDLVIHAEYRDGQLVAVRSNSPSFNKTDHDIDFTRVRWTPNGLSGPVKLKVRSDGFGLLGDQPCQYRIDIRHHGKGRVEGEHSGTYGIRQRRTGTISGRIVGR